MRLLQRSEDGRYSFAKTFVGDDPIPRYAILSHTWGAGGDEVTYEDIINGTGEKKAGFEKIRFCGEQAEHDGLQYFWIDTCCIDKSNEKELTTAINSMFRWYQNAARCYVYLSDVSLRTQDGQAHIEWDSAFRNSRWFTRGWTLQELLAPRVVEFYSRDHVRLGDKKSLEHQIHGITGIDVEALRGRPLTSFSVQERLQWKEKRETTEEEDMAYCLLGIFDVSLPLVYGEGRTKAVNRLLREIGWLNSRSQLLEQEDAQNYKRKEQFHLVQTLKGHGDGVNNLAFSADGRRLASAGTGDNTVRLWDVATGSGLHNLVDRGAPWCVAFSADGRWLASGYSNIIRLWDAATGSTLRTLKHTDSFWNGAIWSVAFSPNGRLLASGSDDNTIRLWDAVTGSALQTLEGHSRLVWCVAFSPNGRRLASGSGDETIRLWDVETGSALQTLKGHSDGVRTVAFSPDGRRLASGSSDNTIRLWDVATGWTLQTLEGHGGSFWSGRCIRSVAFSPDGRRLASGSADKTIRLWDVETGSALQTLKGHSDGVRTVAFSPDGRLLASGSNDRTIRLWGLE